MQLVCIVANVVFAGIQFESLTENETKKHTPTHSSSIRNTMNIMLGNTQNRVKKFALNLRIIMS